MFKSIKKLIPPKIKKTIKKILGMKNEYHYDKNFLTYCYKKKLGLERNAENIKTLVLRGSHADYGFYAESDEIYNLGLTSSDIHTNYHLYLNSQNKLKNLENVIYFFSVFTPGFCLIKTKEKYRSVAYQYFFNVPYQEKNMINPQVEKTIFSKCSKLKITIDDSYRGYEVKEDYMSSVDIDIRAKIHLRENIRSPNQMDIFEKFVSTVLGDARKLYIIIPPSKKSYKDKLPDSPILFSKLYNLKAKYNYEVINFYDSNLFDDSDFGDWDHLNHQGALKLSKIMTDNYLK